MRSWRAWFGLDAPWPAEPADVPLVPTVADLLARVEALHEHVRTKVLPPPPPVGSLPRDCDCGHTSAAWVQRTQDGYVECWTCWEAHQ